MHYVTLEQRKVSVKSSWATSRVAREWSSYSTFVRLSSLPSSGGIALSILPRIYRLISRRYYEKYPMRRGRRSRWIERPLYICDAKFLNWTSSPTKLSLAQLPSSVPFNSALQFTSNNRESHCGRPSSVHLQS